MHDGADKTPLSAAQRALVESAMPELPLEESRVQRTVAAARSLPKPVRHLRLYRAAGLLVVALLVAAGYWRWSCVNSDDLRFSRVVALVDDHAGYSVENIRTATGKIWVEIDAILEELGEQGPLPESLKDGVLSSLDSTEPIYTAPNDDFEDLHEKVKLGQPLTAGELASLTQNIKAGVWAIRKTASIDPRLVEHATWATVSLRERIVPKGP